MGAKTDKLKDIIDIVNEINECSYNYGNEILYFAARLDDNDEHLQEKLEGLLWLIGRSYAASPERRFYGSNHDIDLQKLIDIDKSYKDRKKAPQWPVRSSGDGQGLFFKELASYLVNDGNLKGLLHELNGKSFNFDFSEDDKSLLVVMIDSVSNLNNQIRKGSAIFDNVPENEDLLPKRQISFCSKFLHFVFPEIVFIIDQYSYTGGKRLMSMQSNTASHLGDEEIDKETVKSIHAELRKVEGVSINSFNEEVKNAFSSSAEGLDKESIRKAEENYNLRDYIVHCLNAYAFCCLLKSRNITPLNQAGLLNKSVNICSYPRLTDSVFMSVKTLDNQKYAQLLEFYQRLYQNKQDHNN